MNDESLQPPTAASHRMLSIHVLRHDPRDPASRPHVDTFELEEEDGMTLYLALEEIRDRYDPTLQYDFVCRAGICGSCGMLVNGRPGLGCRTLTRDLPAQIMLAPLPFFELVKDLSVDTGRWMRALTERLQAWVGPAGVEADLDRREAPMDPDLSEAIYELDRCIECGCCVAACGTARMREDFVGAVGLNKVARLRLDPRDEREDAAWYAIVGDDDGVFGCMSLLACQDVCPKELPLRTQIAWLRRAMARTGAGPRGGGRR